MGGPRLNVTAPHALSFNKNKAVENVKGVATRPLHWHKCVSAAAEMFIPFKLVQRLRHKEKEEHEEEMKLHLEITATWDKQP